MMNFSIIYEYECGMSDRIGNYAPSQKHLFKTTEQSDGEPSDWCADLWNGKVKHRKVCGILNRKQFERFLSDTGLYPEDVETMGSLGAPGFGVGLAPAISFTNDDPDSIQSAYVTPFPSFECKTGASDSEKNWRNIRQAILNIYR